MKKSLAFVCVAMATLPIVAMIGSKNLCLVTNSVSGLQIVETPNDILVFVEKTSAVRREQSSRPITIDRSIYLLRYSSGEWGTAIRVDGSGIATLNENVAVFSSINGQLLLFHFGHNNEATIYHYSESRLARWSSDTTVKSIEANDVDLKISRRDLLNKINTMNDASRCSLLGRNRFSTKPIEITSKQHKVAFAVKSNSTNDSIRLDVVQTRAEPVSIVDMKRSRQITLVEANNLVAAFRNRCD